MRLEYSRGIKDHTTKALEAICELAWKLERPNLKIGEFLEEAADLISKQFGIASVTIAVRDPVDKLYRYQVVNGIDQEAVEGFKKIVYTKEQVTDDSTYPGHEISSHTRVYLAEDHPYASGEEFSYRRPALIGMKRRTLSDSLEADYVDFFIYGPGPEILGWIETSGTRFGKLPDATTTRWIELIACLIGHALRLKK